MSRVDLLVTTWLEVDRIKQLVRENRRDELENRLANRIQFGTAGLRGKMEAGFSRMNDVTVLQASQGLACYAINVIPEAIERGVVVGHDHRHNSARFAELTMLAFVQKGFRVYNLGLVHTPLVPFAVDERQAACGIMITASHNPKNDNGYKVYWQNGCQIIPPHDIEISKSIEENLEPWSWDTDLLSSSELVSRPTEALIQAYFHKMNQMLRDSDIVFDNCANDDNASRRDQSSQSGSGDKKCECADDCGHCLREEHDSESLTVVYTPMHGVGLPFFQEAASNLGLPAAAIITVDEQAQPDPDFPTVPFPNPEEEGALDLAMKTADERGIKIVLANDPDADRFAVAIKDGGEWKQLTGNEIGNLFADYWYKRWTRTMKNRRTGKKLAMVNSTVSSKMMAKIAEKHNFLYEETLTGFKWIGNRAIVLENNEYEVPFAYEEALGYMFQVVHDKDGISAAYVFLQMLMDMHRHKQSVIGRLEAMYKEYGYFAEHNSYYISPSAAVTDEVFTYIRNSAKSGAHHPTNIGEFVVAAWRDLTTGYDSTTSDHVPVLPSSRSSQMISVLVYDMSTEDYRSIRFTARGSGTEPKLKVYIEAFAESMPQAQRLADHMWELLRELWFVPKVTGLKEA